MKIPIAIAVAVALSAHPPPISAQESCDACHRELELLRQHVETLPEARALEVPASMLEASAHADMSCSDCHSGYAGFPHASPTETKDCASCHQAADAEWRDGMHATDGSATCADCHGVHDTEPTEDLALPDGIRGMRDVCGACHFEPRIPEDDPHADSVSCSGCHEPHRTLPASDSRSRVHVLNQAETCGTCHDSAAVAWTADAHAAAVRGLESLDGLPLDVAEGPDPPGCTSCHGSHGMLAPSHERFDQDMVARCATCHSDAAGTYFGTYHGKATALGSEIVATCDHCHGSHDIRPADDERSTVSAARLTEMCAACHAQARPAFVLYDSHPNPMDRSRNAPLYYSFVFMNVLLFGVLGLFALHTALWWVRLMIDRQRGVPHGPGGGHG